MKKQTAHIAILTASVVTLTIGILLPGCSKDASAPTTDTNTATATLTGVVTDADSAAGAAIAGATVSAAGSLTATTNARGEFSLTIPAGTTVTVRVTKAGYSLNEVVTNLAPGSAQTVSVGLLRVGAEQSLPVSTGGTVADGAYTFSMPPGFVNAQGNVTVSVTGLDPTTGEVRALPGGLEAVDAQGTIRYLQPVSFAEYTVRDAGGNVLQVSPSVSQGANIELPVPAALRGSPGYTIGDPIECYLYDPKDGKWKTPVPGVIGPSSVDGQPVIKATIFHLSWYGGAPARQQQACVWGYVKDNKGKPVKGAHIEVYVGGSTTTDADGRYQVAAAPNSFVRIVASVVQGDSIMTGETTVETGDGGGGCTGVHDIVLGRKEQAKYFVWGTYYPYAPGAYEAQPGVCQVWVYVSTSENDAIPYSGASVKIGEYNGEVEIPLAGDGYYFSNKFNSSSSLGMLEIDVDQDGIPDGYAHENVPGSIDITYPLDNDIAVPPSFDASWVDSRADGYDEFYKVRYVLDMTGDSLNSFSVTLDDLSFLVGDGSVYRDIFGVNFINHPLAAGDYSMNILPFDGPPELFGLTGTTPPNVTSFGAVGAEVTGYYYIFGEAASTSFTVVGGGKAVRIGTTKPRQGLAPDRVAKQFEKIRQARARAALSRSPLNLTRSGGSHPPGHEQEWIRKKR